MPPAPSAARLALTVLSLQALGLLVLSGHPSAGLAQGRSQSAPGHQKGENHPGKGKGSKSWESRRDDRGGGDHDRDDDEHNRWDDHWEDRQDQRRRVRSVRREPLDLWIEPVRIRPEAYRPVWASPNWLAARPWPKGWYGTWGQPPWGWWPEQSAAWGGRPLATGTLINRALSQALGWQQPTIAVPSTPWRLLYGTVEPVGSSGVRFVVNNGYGTYRVRANCQRGLLNDQVPTSFSQAQLLHAACQVAYGGPVPAAPVYGGSGYAAPGYGGWGYGSDGYGNPGYRDPGYGAPGYGGSVFGLPGFGWPDF